MKSHASAALFASLTLALGFAAHLIVELISVGGGALLQPSHIVLASVSAGGIAWALASLGVGRSRSERRRRSSLAFASAQRAPRSSAFAIAAGQALVAAATLAPEGLHLDPSRLGIALLCGLLSIAAGTAIVRAVYGRIIRLCIERFSLDDPCPAPRIRRRESRLPQALRLVLYALFVPNRPPPAFS